MNFVDRSKGNSFATFAIAQESVRHKPPLIVKIRSGLQRSKGVRSFRGQKILKPGHRIALF